MNKKYRFTKGLITLCIVAGLLSGCGGDSEESTDTAVTEGQETVDSIDINDTSEENDEQGNDEPDKGMVSDSNDESVAQSRGESVRSVTIYYVDDLSAVVVGEKRKSVMNMIYGMH